MDLASFIFVYCWVSERVGLGKFTIKKEALSQHKLDNLYFSSCHLHFGKVAELILHHNISELTFKVVASLLNHPSDCWWCNWLNLQLLILPTGHLSINASFYFHFLSERWFILGHEDTAECKPSVFVFWNVISFQSTGGGCEISRAGRVSSQQTRSKQRRTYEARADDDLKENRPSKTRAGRNPGNSDQTLRFPEVQDKGWISCQWTERVNSTESDTVKMAEFDIVTPKQEAIWGAAESSPASPAESGSGSQSTKPKGNM